MYDIFKSEFLRYRKWALLLMTLHLAGAWFAHVSGWLHLGQNSPVFGSEWMAAIVGGLLFGLLQIGLHKRPSSWAYLIHRPLSGSRIFLGMFLAAAAIVGLSLVVPSLIIITLMDVLTEHVVDVRHYLFPLHILGIALATYLVGAYTQLYPNRAVVISIALLSFVVIYSVYTTPLSTFVPLVVVNCWLFYLCQKAFKPDLSQHFVRPLTILLAAVPLQLAFAFLLIFIQVPLYHLPLFAAGKHPDKQVQADTYEAFRYDEDEQKQAVYFLEKIGGERAQELIRAAQLGQTGTIGYVGADGSFPKRHGMLVQDEPYRFFSPDQSTVWAFSHDHMLYKGYAPASGNSVGWIGKNGFSLKQEEAEKFLQVPAIYRGRFVVTKDAVRRINFDDQLVELVFTLSNDETLTGGVTVNEQYAAVATDQRLYLFDSAGFQREEVEMQPEFVLEHPDALRPLGWIFSVNLIDGYLLTYIREPDYMPYAVATRTYYAKFDGTVELIGDYQFSKSKHPLVVYFNQFINSPVMAFAHSLFYQVAAPGQKTWAADVAERPIPRVIWIIAGALSLLSTLLVVLLARRLRLEAKRCWVWATMTLLVGVPGLLSFLVLNNWREIIRRPRVAA